MNVEDWRKVRVDRVDGVGGDTPSLLTPLCTPVAGFTPERRLVLSPVQVYARTRKDLPTPQDSFQHETPYEAV